MRRRRIAVFFRGCPHCGSVDFRSVGVTNFVQQALYWILQPCRCSLCGHQFFLVRWRSSLRELPEGEG